MWIPIYSTKLFCAAGVAATLKSARVVPGFPTTTVTGVPADASSVVES
ncbi:MAG: hypothetical protein IKD21_00135 [Clostridia bacterium]|nr:hypothetical protein [Clostridia bacterium]